MLSLANKSYLQFISSLRLQYENALLMKQLQAMNSELHDEIREHEKAKNQLRYLATHDFLTALDNRYSFDVSFEKMLLAARSTHGQFCVLYADVDHFKQINDNYGHDQGDRILLEVAERLRKSLRPKDRIARVGGDEFIILLAGPEAKNAARHFVQQVQKAFEYPLQLDEQTLLLSVSFGGSLFPQDGHEKQVLLKKADLALYRAKFAGRNCAVFYGEKRESVV